METSRDKRTETEGAPCIRLRYSRQFQNAGHTHTIDAEAALDIGANTERREQIIRELEAGVDLLARQITQRAARPASEAHPQTSARSGAAPVVPAAPAPTRASEPVTPSVAPPRPEAQAAPPAAPLPISASMPTTPPASSERRITLPQFVEYIKKRWNMSAKEAMDLLEVRELANINLFDALYKLRAIKEPRSAQKDASPTASRSNQPQPQIETPRQAPRASNPPRASAGAPDTAPVTHTQMAAPRQETRPTPRATRSAPTAPQAFSAAAEPDTTEREQERDARPDFAGSPKAPLPILPGVVREISARSYAFEEEDEEEYELPLDHEENEHLRAAESKVEELKSIRTGNAASPERLNVLNNVLDGQISEQELEQLLQIIWNQTSKKKLRSRQVEELISWAKEDFFADEVKALLAQIEEEEA